MTTEKEFYEMVGIERDEAFNRIGGLLHRLNPCEKASSRIRIRKLLGLPQDDEDAYIRLAKGLVGVDHNGFYHYPVELSHAEQLAQASQLYDELSARVDAHMAKVAEECNREADDWRAIAK